MNNAPVALGTAHAVIASTDFSVAEIEHHAGAYYRAHTHERSYVSLALTGGFDEQVGTRGDRVSSASVVVMPAGVAHEDRIGARGNRSLLVTFAPSSREVLEREPRSWSIVHGGAPARVLLRLYRAFRIGDGEETTMQELLIELHDALAHEARVHDAVPARCVVRALDLLNAARSPLRLADIARDCGVDPAYLARAFRRFRGTTMGEHVRRVRAKRAAALLASTSMAIAALACGFADQSHLTRVFHAELGFSPAAFRRLMSNPFKTAA
jgi:AraC family transcriptional regulator